MPKVPFTVNDIEVDGTTLTVDEVNNRVGVGTDSPAHTLDVVGTVKGSNGVITLTTAGTPSSSIADGALAIDTTNDKLYIRSGSSWVEVAGGGGGGSSVTTSDAPPSSPSAGDLWYESDTGSFYIYYDSFWVSISGTVPSATVISDADGDTKVQVEESPDEDVIRFDTAGVQRAFINSSGLDVNGSISVSGTVDGRDIATDGSKLDGIESGADVTDSINVAGSIENITLTSITGATGDEFLVIDATDGGLKAVLWENISADNAVRDSLILSYMSY